MTKVEHQRAPWRDPSRQHEERLPTSESEGVFQRVAAAPPAVRPPPEHADVEYHWVETRDSPRGEPMRWSTADDTWSDTFGNRRIAPSAAAAFGWRWIAPCEPPKEGSFW